VLGTSLQGDKMDKLVLIGIGQLDVVFADWDLVTLINVRLEIKAVYLEEEEESSLYR
jgi:hypothetical protein